MKKLSVLILVCVFSLTLTSFAMASEKEWTFMVYLNGDNNLEGAGIKDFNEMETVGSNSKANILVQFDRCKGYDTSNGDWEGTKRFYVTKDSNMSTIRSKVVQDLGEVDMGSGRELAKFVKWSKDNYPAKHYCLVLWNHGMGWRDGNNNMSSLLKGVSYDDQSGNHLDTPELGKAMKDIYNILGKKLDIIAFDACLMQMAEVQYEIKDFANYMIASEETEPGDGWPYDQVCPYFTAGRSARECASKVVDEYLGFYKGNSGVTQAAMDLSKAKGIKEVTDALADAMISNMSKVRSDIAGARKGAQEFAVTDYVDLYDFASNLSKTNVKPVKEAAKNVMNFIKNSGYIVNEGYEGQKTSDSHGISMWIPSSTSGSSSWWSQPLPYDSKNRKAYTYLKMSVYGTWDNFLAAYHGNKQVAVEMIDEINNAMNKKAFNDEEMINRADVVSSLVSSYVDMLNNSEEAMTAYKELETTKLNVLDLIDAQL